MKLNKIVDQENQILLYIGSSNSASVSKTELASTSTCLQGLFLKNLHNAIISILCLCHLYKSIFTTVHLILSLLTSLRCEIIQPSLHVSLWSEILLSFFLVHLRSGILQSSLLASLRSGTLPSSLLTSLLVCLWNICLRCLYKDSSTLTSIP